MSKPNKGDHYKCASCGMEVQVNTPCGCKDGDPIFACCGKSMEKVAKQVAVE